MSDPSQQQGFQQGFSQGSGRSQMFTNQQGVSSPQQGYSQGQGFDQNLGQQGNLQGQTQQGYEQQGQTQQGNLQGQTQQGQTPQGQFQGENLGQTQHGHTSQVNIQTRSIYGQKQGNYNDVTNHWNLIRVLGIDHVEVVNQSLHEGEANDYLEPGHLSSADLQISLSIPINVPANSMAVRVEECKNLLSRTVKVELGCITQLGQTLPSEPPGSFYRYSFIVPLVRDGTPSWFDKFNLQDGPRSVHYTLIIPGLKSSEGNKMNTNFYIQLKVIHSTNQVDIQSITNSFIPKHRIKESINNFKTWGNNKINEGKERYHKKKAIKQQEKGETEHGHSETTQTQNPPLQS